MSARASAGYNHCPVCRAALWAPDDEPVGQQTCPRCSAALWVLVGAGAPMFFPRRPGESASDFLAVLCDAPTEQMEVALRTADHLDLVELVVELEEAAKSGRG